MKYRELVPKPTGYERTISRTADPRNTVKEMKRIATENAWQVEKLAKALSAGLIEELEARDKLESLWHWVRKNIRYVNDPAKAETLRTPSRTVHDGKGDCDCMSILISAVLINWRVPHLIRVVDVKGNGWDHVYIVALEAGEQICMDTVPEIRYFGHEHIYIKKFDTMMHTVELGGLGAIDAGELEAVRLELKIILAQMEEVRFSSQEEEALREKEAAILKIVLASLDSDREERIFTLEQAVQQSFLLQDVYIELLRTDQSEGLSGLFSKIKEGLDKLGDTGIGRVFRSVRDKVVPIVDPLGLSKVGGKIFNSIAENGSGSDKEDIQNFASQIKTLTVPSGSLPSTQKTGDVTASDAPGELEEPWYKTTKGMIGIGVGSVAIILLIVWLVKSSQSKRLSGIRRRRRKPTAAAAKRRKATRKALSGISMKRRATASAPAKRRKRKATAKATTALIKMLMQSQSPLPS